jgi:hypothetical protein
MVEIGFWDNKNITIWFRDDAFMLDVYKWWGL